MSTSTPPEAFTQPPPLPAQPENGGPDSGDNTSDSSLSTRDLALLLACLVAVTLGVRWFFLGGGDSELVAIAKEKVELWNSGSDFAGPILYPQVGLEVLDPPEENIVLLVAGQVFDEAARTEIVQFLEGSEPMLRPDEYLLELVLAVNQESTVAEGAQPQNQVPSAPSIGLLGEVPDSPQFSSPLNQDLLFGDRNKGTRVRVRPRGRSAVQPRGRMPGGGRAPAGRMPTQRMPPGMPPGARRVPQAGGQRGVPSRGASGGQRGKSIGELLQGLE